MRINWLLLFIFIIYYRQIFQSKVRASFVPITPTNQPNSILRIYLKYNQNLSIINKSHILMSHDLYWYMPKTGKYKYNHHHFMLIFFFNCDIWQPWVKLKIYLLSHHRFLILLLNDSTYSWCCCQYYHLG